MNPEFNESTAKIGRWANFDGAITYPYEEFKVVFTIYRENDIKIIGEGTDLKLIVKDMLDNVIAETNIDDYVEIEEFLTVGDYELTITSETVGPFNIKILRNEWEVYIGTEREYFGTFWPGEDTHYINFEVDEDGGYDIYITSNEIGSYYLELYNENGDLLGSTKRTGNQMISDYIFEGNYVLKIISEHNYRRGDYTFRREPNNMALMIHGIEYEQEDVSIWELTAPSIDNIEVEILDFIHGIYKINLRLENCTLDTRATPFFFWESTEGTFDDYEDITGSWITVIFRANPGTGGRDVRAVIGVGDSLGQIDRKAVLLKGNEDEQ